MKNRAVVPGNFPKSKEKSFYRKSISKLLAVFIVAGLFFTACEDDPAGVDDPDPAPEVEASFTIEPESPNAGDEVTLDATGSTVTNNGDIEYSWTLTTPEGSEAELESETSEITGFTADVAGEFDISLLVSVNGVSDAASEAIDVTAEEEISSDISSERTLSSGVTYFVTDEIEITAELTIEPGTEIYFEAGAGLEIPEMQGAIIADGTEAEPILFSATNEQPGWWNGIYLEQTSNINNVLNYVIVEYGGGEEFRNSGSGNVIVGRQHRDDSSVEITNSIIRYSDSNGIWVHSNGDLPNFNHNTFAGNGDAQVNIASNRVHRLESNNIFDDGSEDDRVYVRSGYDIEDEDVTWKALDVPYLVGPDAIEVLGVNMTIDPGSILEFESGGELRLADNGGLIADGNDNEPILFTGTHEQAGWWNGIYFEEPNPAGNRLNHVTVEYGGGTEYRNSGSGNIVIGRQFREDASVEITNSTIRYSDSNGIWVRSNGELPGFENNSIENNDDAPVSIASNRVHNLDAGSTYSGDSDTYVYVRGGSDIEDEDVTWEALNVPYRVNSSTIEVLGVGLTIEPGTTLEFESGGQLRLDEHGGLIADGTDNEPIIFTATNEQAGWWDGIYLEESSFAGNVLNYVTVEYAGGTEYNNSGSGNVVVGRLFRDDSNIDITNSTLRNSDSYGLWVHDNGNVNEDACEVNTFESNSGEDCVVND